MLPTPAVATKPRSVTSLSVLLSSLAPGVLDLGSASSLKSILSPGLVLVCDGILFVMGIVVPGVVLGLMAASGCSWKTSSAPRRESENLTPRQKSGAPREFEIPNKFLPCVVVEITLAGGCVLSALCDDEISSSPRDTEPLKVDPGSPPTAWDCTPWWAVAMLDSLPRRQKSVGPPLLL
jgi:hypothetical protein